MPGPFLHPCPQPCWHTVAFAMLWRNPAADWQVEVRSFKHFVKFVPRNRCTAVITALRASTMDTAQYPG